eukprot:g70911.t1
MLEFVFGSVVKNFTDFLLDEGSQRACCFAESSTESTAEATSLLCFLYNFQRPIHKLSSPQTSTEKESKWKTKQKFHTDITFACPPTLLELSERAPTQLTNEPKPREQKK